MAFILCVENDLVKTSRRAYGGRRRVRFKASGRPVVGGKGEGREVGWVDASWTIFFSPTRQS